MSYRRGDPDAGDLGRVYPSEDAEDIATRIGAAVLAEAVAGDERSVALSFSSEAPVLRDCYFGSGWEVPGHLPAEVDLARAAGTAAPLLAGYRRSFDAKLVSVIPAQVILARGRAMVRFVQTPSADDLFARVRAAVTWPVSRSGQTMLPLAFITSRAWR